MKSFIYAGILLALLSSQADADVLFIDMNISPREVAIARAAARDRGEGFHLIPETPPKQSEVLKTLRARKDAAHDEYYGLLPDVQKWEKSRFPFRPLGFKEKKARLEEAMKRYQAINDEFQQEADKYKIGIDDIDSMMSRLEKNGIKLSTIVISGESSGEGYWGGAAKEYTRSDLHKILVSHSSLISELTTILHWACSAGTIEATSWWHFKFPKVFNAGFSTSGPSGKTEYSYKTLDYVLRNEHKARATNDLDGLKAWLDSAKKASPPLAETSFAFGVNNVYGGVMESFSKISVRTECSQSEEKMAVGSALYFEYFNASSEEFANPPTDGSSSKLRQYYRELQRNYQCRKFYESIGINVPERNEAAALIHFTNIERAFARENRAKLEAANGAIKKLRMSRKHLIPIAGLETGSLRRKELKAWLVDITIALEDLSARRRASEHFAPVYELINEIDSKLNELTNIPANWITEE